MGRSLPIPIRSEPGSIVDSALVPLLGIVTLHPAISSLSPLFPGTMIRSFDLSALSLTSNRSSAFRALASGPWQSRQFSDRIGKTSRLNRTDAESPPSASTGARSRKHRHVTMPCAIRMPAASSGAIVLVDDQRQTRLARSPRNGRAGIFGVVKGCGNTSHYGELLETETTAKDNAVRTARRRRHCPMPHRFRFPVRDIKPSEVNFLRTTGQSEQARPGVTIAAEDRCQTCRHDQRRALLTIRDGCCDDPIQGRGSDFRC